MFVGYAYLEKEKLVRFLLATLLAVLSPLTAPLCAASCESLISSSYLKRRSPPRSWCLPAASLTQPRASVAMPTGMFRSPKAVLQTGEDQDHRRVLPEIGHGRPPRERHAMPRQHGCLGHHEHREQACHPHGRSCAGRLRGRPPN